MVGKKMKKCISMVAVTGFGLALIFSGCATNRTANSTSPELGTKEVEAFNKTVLKYFWNRERFQEKESVDVVQENYKMSISERSSYLSEVCEILKDSERVRPPHHGGALPPHRQYAQTLGL